MTDKTRTIAVTDRELHTILAALRYWQRCGGFAGDDINDIADNGGEVEPLAADEIDTLCEEANCGERDREHSSAELLSAVDAYLSATAYVCGVEPQRKALIKAGNRTEAEVRRLWTAHGVSRERQDELIADIKAKAQPGTKVGPFTRGDTL